jgi:hypothetical protein
MYTCHYCNHEFPTRTVYILHLDTTSNHWQQWHVCAQHWQDGARCTSTFKHRKAFTQHLRAQHRYCEPDAAGAQPPAPDAADQAAALAPQAAALAAQAAALADQAAAAHAVPVDDDAQSDHAGVDDFGDQADAAADPVPGAR